MSRTSHRHARSASSLVLFAVALAATAWAPSSARAQEGSVTMTLLEQTPFTTTAHPRLTVAVVATDAGVDRYTDLELALDLGSAFRSRLEYEASLVVAPEGVTIALEPLKGALGPGEARTFRLRVDLSKVPAVTQDENLVYPAAVRLLSEGTPVATLATAVIHLWQTPERPVLFNLSAEMTAPLALDPQGRLSDPGFVAAISPVGNLGAQAQALRDVATAPAADDPIDLVIQPSLVEQATRAAAGYTGPDGTPVPAGQDGAAAATAFLQTLKAVATLNNIQVVAMPFAAPELPSLLNSDLAADLDAQRALGNRWLSEGLGAAPSAAVARPPGGALDEASLAWLAGSGTTTVLADVNTVGLPAQPSDFAPPAVATVNASRDDLSLVLPDPGTQGLLSRSDLLSDPVRAAQAVLGELAVIWKEQPVPPDQPDGTATKRGLALTLPSTLPASLWDPLLTRLTTAPFLEPVHAQTLAAGVNPAGQRAELLSPSFATFPPSYVEQIHNLRRDVQAYRSMLPPATVAPDQMERDLAYAESSQYLPPSDPLGKPWLDGVSGAIGDAFARVRPTAQPVFTFTSQEGTIPLRMGDPGDTPLTVSVQLRSAQFEFPDGDRQSVTLSRANQIVSFRVVAKASGQNPIQVLVMAPSGQVISDQTLVVRSTAVNRFALLITGGAAIGLLLLWLRRLMRRRSA